MKLLFTRHIFLLFLLSSFSAPLFAQSEISTPLSPERGFIQREVGLVFGLGSNIQGGKFFTACDCPAFDNGILTGITAGFLYEQDFFSDLQFGGALLYDNRSLMASYQDLEQIDVTSQTTNLKETKGVLFRQKADVKLDYITLQPYIKWTPANFFFLKVGFSGSFLFNSNITHTKELLTRTARLSNGEIVEVKLLRPDGKPVNGNSFVVENGAIPQTKSFQLFLAPMIGFTFPLAENVFLSPVFEFSVPMTEVSSRGDAFRIYSWRILGELRWAIRLRRH